MTNEEKINLIGKKILLLSSNLEKYQTELNQLKYELQQLQQKTTIVQPKQEVKPVLPVIEKKEEVKVEVKEEPVIAKPIIQEAPFQKPIPVFETPKTQSSDFNFEEFIGAKLITIIGIAVLVIGLGIGVKYAIDQDLITPLTRIILAYLAGGIILALALKLKEKFKTFSAVLLSGGMASLYFTTFAAYSMYSLFPQLVAFGIMLIFTVFTVYAATMYALEIIGIIGLVGAYFVPVLLSDGTGKIEIMFSYMSIINIGILVLSFKKYWKILNHFSFGLTWIIYSSWYLDKYDYEKHIAFALAFAFVFFCIFYISTMAYKILKQEKFDAVDIIRIATNSFIFFGLGYASLNNPYCENYLGLFTVFNALIHLIFSYVVFRNKLLDRKLFYFLIALVLTFVTIAVPVQLEGNWVTLFWSAEAVLLFYIGRKKGIRFYEWISFAMIVFAVFSLWQDWAKNYSSWLVYDESFKDRIAFININFLSSIFTTLSVAGILFYHFKNKISEEIAKQNTIYKVVEYTLSVLLFILTYTSLSSEINMFFQIKYQASHIEVPSSYAWAEAGAKMDVYDESWNYLKKVYLTIYNLLFYIVFTVLVIRKLDNVFVRWASFTLNMMLALIFISASLDDFSHLRFYALNNENFKYYSLSSSVLYLRYICFALVAYLLVLTYKLLKTNTFRNYSLSKFFNGSIIHFFILIILCSELINIHQLNLERGENIFHSTNAIYKIGFTVLFTIYSFALIAFGIFKKNRIMRISAIVLFGITLLKLVTFDTWNLSTGYKVICYILLGVILLVVAFLYQKFKVLIFGNDAELNNKES